MSSEHAGEHGSDYVGAKLGMWFFLFTEILLFGGLFLVYSVYRSTHAVEFHKAAGQLDSMIGAANTLILITSSLFVALSISAVQKNELRRAGWYIVLTTALGGAFLVNKYFEWSHHISDGMFPDSPSLLSLSKGENLFFGLYYVMTGLHSVHVIGGLAVLGIALVLLKKGRVTSTNFVFLENAGLFWHLVDLIWIYLFPLFYLVT
ncbi:MAG: cytochrome c oxidase subunit 3 family protein [Chlorobiales bacterium]|jgi:cytochrome c oxidase subunit III|nr:cytochrome c oxidase subunit 3 family protein [Chlorobiales bacterium]